MGAFGMSVPTTPAQASQPGWTPPPAPNPNPRNFEILKAHTDVEPRWERGGWRWERSRCVLVVRYPDCTNYEGIKVLVYDDVHLHDLLYADFLDPHFSEEEGFFPIARFRPTEEGVRHALSMLKIAEKDLRDVVDFLYQEIAFVRAAGPKR